VELTSSWSLCRTLDNMHAALVLSSALGMSAHVASFRTDRQWLQCEQLVSGNPLRMRSSLWLLSWEWHRCMAAQWPASASAVLHMN
jgi:hypothetical protein